MPNSKEITDRKRQANKQNAQKSTGPRTHSAKARVAANATTHGLLARNILMHDTHFGEDARDFDQLLNDLMNDFDPQNQAERLLVERITAAYWRLRRAYTFETQAIRRADRNQKQKQLVEIVLIEDKSRTDPPAIPNQPDLERLIRYEGMISRELNRASIQLRAIQAARKIRPEIPDSDEKKI